MLVAAEIINHVKQVLDSTSQLHSGIFQYPYILVCHADQWQKNGGSHEQNLKITRKQDGFTFRANPAYHWLPHVIILASGITSFLYQNIFEDTTVLQISTHLIEVLLFAGCTAFAFLQYQICKPFSGFLNQSMQFEKRWVDCTGKIEQEYWRHVVSYRNVVILALHITRLCLLLNSFVQAITALICSSCPWRIVPLGIYQGVAQCELGIDHTLMELIGKCFAALFAFVTWCIWDNQALILLSLSFTSAHCILYYMVLAMKRHLRSVDTSKYSSWKPDIVVQMFREAQLLCAIYNDIHKRHMIPLSMVMAVAGSSISLFALVSRWSNMDLKTVLVFGNGVAMGINVVVITFRLAVKLRVESNMIKPLFVRRERNNGIDKKSSRILQRYWKSFPAFRVSFFETNFFDRNTPLVMLHFIFDGTINLILLDNGQNLNDH